MNPALTGRISRNFPNSLYEPPEIFCGAQILQGSPVASFPKLLSLCAAPAGPPGSRMRPKVSRAKTQALDSALTSQRTSNKDVPF